MNKPNNEIKILIIEDVVAQAAHIKSRFQKVGNIPEGNIVTIGIITDLEKEIESILRGKYDIILIDGQINNFIRDTGEQGGMAYTDEIIQFLLSQGLQTPLLSISSISDQSDRYKLISSHKLLSEKDISEILEKREGTKISWVLTINERLENIKTIKKKRDEDNQLSQEKIIPMTEQKKKKRRNLFK